MLLFQGWSIGFLQDSFSKKRLSVLRKILAEQGAKIVDLMTCDHIQMRSFEAEDSHHVIIADAQKSQNISGIFEECSKFNPENLKFYSADWISDSMKAKHVLPIQSYVIHGHHHEPMSKKSKQEPDLVGNTSQLLAKDFVNTPYDCLRPAPLDHKNKGLVSELSKIARHRYLTGNSRSELSYNKAIAILKAYPKDITSVEEAAVLQGIGPKILGLVEEFLSTGKIRIADELEQDKQMQTLDLLTKIHGVGPRTAQNWYSFGIRSISDLQDYVMNGEVVLKEDQKIGLKYYDDFLLKMTRPQVEEIFSIVKDAVRRLFEDRVIVEMTGGYRRGKQFNGDADILLHPVGKTPLKADILDALLKELRPLYIKDLLTLSKAPKAKNKEGKSLDVCFMAFQVRKGEPMRRVDFIVSSRVSYAFAMLGWTGSRQFERSIRLFSKHEHGITLTDRDMVGRKGEISGFDDERQIFEHLGVPYLDPTLRNC